MFDLPFTLPEGWELKTVEELINEGLIEKPLDGNHGGTHPKADDYVKEGIPFIMASDLENGRVSLNSCKFISQIQASRLRKGFAKKGDVLLSHKATIGRTAIIQDNEYEYIMLTPQVTYYRIKDSDRISNVYLKAYFDSNFFQSILNLWAGAGSTRAYLGITAQLKLPVIVPPINKQISIANHIGTINDKIETKREISQSLESIAQSIFQSWFVDFEPVKVKENILEKGGTQEDAELAAMSTISTKNLHELKKLKEKQRDSYNQLKKTAALFPSAMQDSELGRIPTGWKNKKLNAVCRVINGRAYKNTEFKESGTPIIRIQNLSGKGKTVYSDLSLPEDKLVDKEDFVYAWSATFGPFIWRGDKSIYHYHIWKMEVDETIISRYFLYLSMFRKTESMKNAGTGSIFTHLTKGIMESQDILIGNDTLNQKFSSIVNDIFKSISSNHIEIQKLSQIRDTLLSKLLTDGTDVHGGTE